VLGCADRGRATADEQVGFDVLGGARLGEVRAGDQQDAALGDGELRTIRPSRSPPERIPASPRSVLSEIQLRARRAPDTVPSIVRDMQSWQRR
jgi:hypothetical protein